MKYTVIKGDSLWSISKEFLGRGSKWKKIYSYNYNIIGDNPDIIHAGQILTIPRCQPYRFCLKREIAVLEATVESGDRDYLGRLFNVQDELMAEDIVLFVKISVFISVLFIVLKISL